MNKLPTCLDIEAECNNEPCIFSHDHKCTFHCRQWRHIDPSPTPTEREKVLELVSGAIENQKDHKEFLLTRGQKDIVLDIIDGIRAELRTAKDGEQR